MVFDVIEQLDSEPKKIASPSDNGYNSSFFSAPPPYQSYSSLNHTSAMALAYGAPSILPHDTFCRRASWSELAASADDKNFVPPSTVSSFVSVTGQPMPTKVNRAPSDSHPNLCLSQRGTPSVVYMNNNTDNNGNESTFPRQYHDAYAIPTKAGASGQLSISSSSGVVSDFFTFQMKGSPSYQKFTETGVHFSPMPGGQTAGSPLSGSTNVGTTPVNSLSGAHRSIPPTSAASVPVPAGGGGSSGAGSISSRRVKRNRMEDIRQCCRKTPSRLALCVLFSIAIIVIVASVFLYEVLHVPTHLQFTWLAPELLRAGQPAPNQLQMDVAGQQIRFELAGNMPFKSNFVSVLDFKTNKVAIVDSSLRSGNRNLVCFVMEMDRANIVDMASLQKAAANAASRTTQHLGWQEMWNFIPVPLSMTATSASKLFHPDVVECRGARWIELRPVHSNQKPLQCSECYDFCLPEYGIEKDYIRDESFLNIVRRDCFYLFVPEWRSYAQAYTNQQNQQDFENYYRHNGQYQVSANQQQQQILSRNGVSGVPGVGSYMPRAGVTNLQQQLQQHQGSSTYAVNPYGNGYGDGRTPNQNIVNTLNQAGREMGDTLANSVGSGIQQGGQRLGEFVAGIRPQLQNVGENAEAKWIELGNVPGRIANASSTAWNTLQGGASYVKQQLFNGNDNIINNGRNTDKKNDNNNHVNSQFPTSGFDFAESQFTSGRGNGGNNNGASNNGRVTLQSGVGDYVSDNNRIVSDNRQIASSSAQFTGNLGIPRIEEVNGNYNQRVSSATYTGGQPQPSLQQLLQQQSVDTRQQIGSGRYDANNGGYSISTQHQQNPARLSQMFDNHQFANNNNNNFNAGFGIDLSNQRRIYNAGSDALNSNGGGFGADLSNQRSHQAK